MLILHVQEYLLNSILCFMPLLLLCANSVHVECYDRGSMSYPQKDGQILLLNLV